MRSLVAAALVVCAGSALVAGCSSDTGPTDELMVSSNPVAATAARSPEQSATPPGAVLPLDAPVTAVAVDAGSRTLALAVATPPSIRLLDLDRLDTEPRTVPLDGPASALSVADGALVAALGERGSVVRVDLASARATPSPVDGAPVDSVAFGADTLVAVRDQKGVAVLGGDNAVRKVITGGLLSADQVYGTGRGAVVLDRLRNAVFQVDVGGGTIGEGLRAGQGSTNGVVDRHDRVLVTDTRGGALLAFSVEPMLMRQRFPVPGAPYGIAYDPQRDLAWVTLTERNEVVAFAVAGGEPVERHRFPTVTQPDSVAVDPATGRVVVASATGAGVQVITP
ncbi:YncE family protein [Actinokineospora sp. G85]|uniref:YncE family protein n=1 Tax=Actinokineospora sp. G85 TaxID=3406626 RepID=UPI003C790F78